MNNTASGWSREFFFILPLAALWDWLIATERIGWPQPVWLNAVIQVGAFFAFAPPKGTVWRALGWGLLAAGNLAAFWVVDF